MKLYLRKVHTILTTVKGRDLLRRNKYQDYIYWLAESVEYPLDEYSELFECLMNIEFVWSIRNDENRAADALNLRHEFEFEWGEIPELIDKGPMVLEVLVKMAIRAADIVYDSDEKDKTPFFFDEMIHNLSLNEYVNGCCDELLVQDIVFKWMDRVPGYCLFNIKNVPKPLEEVEFWNQMNWYLTEYYIENYGLEDDTFA